MTKTTERSTHDGQWHRPPEQLTLNDNEIHIWRIPLDRPLAEVQFLRSYLNGAEIARADRFYFEKDQQQFAVGRGVLREILSRYLEVSPQAVSFSYNEYLKPFLLAELDSADLQFNLSHSGSMALCAVTRQREIGVDIEEVRTNLEYVMIAEKFFAPQEVAVFQQVPAALQPTAFFNCWTRKEAYIKAQGQGLSLALDSFYVTLVPGEEAQLLWVKDEPDEAAEWAMCVIEPGDGYIGALAVRAHGLMYQFFDWSV